MNFFKIIFRIKKNNFILKIIYKRNLLFKIIEKSRENYFFESDFLN